MAEAKKRTKLTDTEWNAISHLTRSSHLDESFDVYQKRNGDDCFKDMQDGRLKSLNWGLSLLEECIAYPLKHEGLNDNEANALVNLFKEFKIGNDDWCNWLLSDEDE